MKEIASSENLHFRLGIIYSEIKKEYLLDMLKRGRCKPLQNAPCLTEETIKKSSRIVGLAGIEPFIECLDKGCQVIIAGRSSDTSIYAALPIKMGLPPGPVWHAAKILECGAACVAQRKYPDCMFASIDELGFRVEPPNPDYYCTPVSVASHMLYENASPFELVEPSGMLDARIQSIYGEKIKENYNLLFRVFRSKNAGPFELTIDIMFENQVNYARVKNSNRLSPAFISDLYQNKTSDITIEYFDAAYAIKISFPRPTVSGSFRDADVLGGQQYGPLVDLEIP